MNMTAEEFAQTQEGPVMDGSPVIEVFASILLPADSVAHNMPSDARCLELYDVLRSQTLADPVHFLRVQLGVPETYAAGIVKRLREFYEPQPMHVPGANVPAGTITTTSMGGIPGGHRDVQLAALEQQLAEQRQVIDQLLAERQSAEAGEPEKGPPHETGRKPSKRGRGQRDSVGEGDPDTAKRLME